MKLLLFICSLFFIMTRSYAVDVQRIDPVNWFAGMKDTHLQLMIYGKGIAHAQVSLPSSAIRLDSVVRPASPNYLLVYLDLKDAPAGEYPIVFTQGKQRTVVQYRLSAREMPGEQRQGFTHADVLYMLMPDRFAQGTQHKAHVKGMNPYREDRSEPSLRHGGDLQGIEDHLDYFKDLGVTALWLTPVLENNSPDNGRTSTYHGYATTDYYRVDPRFGTNDDYKRLIGKAHQKGLKVVMDMIFNHCGLEHPWVDDMPMKDWFNEPQWLQQRQGKTQTEGTDYLQTSYKLTPVLDPYAAQVDRKETVDGWFVPTMPDLNQRNPHVATYLLQNSKWWIETCGIDGIRMDTYPYADRTAMAQWMRHLLEEYPHFNVVGETWVEEPAYTAAWQKDSPLTTVNSFLPTVMDFSFYEKINRAKGEQTDGGQQGLNRVYASLVYDYLYAKPENVLAFIDNHDTDRFLSDGQDSTALKQALALLLTIKRTPQLYYGTEILMNGTKRITDGNVRKDFPGGFPGDQADAFTPQGRTPAQNALWNWLSRLLHWRQGNPLVLEGKQTQFIPHDGVYVVARTLGDKAVLTILNGTSAPATFRVKRYAEVIGRHTVAHDVATGEAVNVQDDIKLTPRQTLILEF